MFRFTLLQRHILHEVVRVFSFVLVCTTVLLVFVGLFQQATEAGLHPLRALRILPYVITMMLPFTIPAALLLTVSVVYGRLTGDQELTAAKAAGVHPLSLMWPALGLGAVLSLGSLLLTDQVIPWSVNRIEQHILAWMEDIFLEKLRTEHRFADPKHGLLVSVQGLDGKRLLRPIIQFTKGKTPITIQCEQAQIDLDVQNRQIQVTGWNGVIEIAGRPPSKFRGQRGPHALRWDAENQEIKPRHLPVMQIDHEILSMNRDVELRRQSAALHAAFAFTSADFPELVHSQAERLPNVKQTNLRLFKLKTEIHSRYALACSCFFFVLMGTPFSMRFGKSQYLSNFLLCFVPIVCGYYPLMLGLMTQAKKGHIACDWPLWIANALLATAALWIMRRVIRH